MLKGENINGYIILNDFVVAGGMSKVSFAQKGGKEYFIKEFLYPKYPTTDSPGSEKVKEQKRKACDAFEKHHRSLNQKIATKVSFGGNLVYAVDFFRYGTCYYKVTEKIDTTSISPNDISKLPLDKILLICKSVCHSVRILHDLGIVHGDLKPDNILIKKTSMGYSGKLIDFDDSYFIGEPPKDRESLVGTPEYYSPEQAAYIMDEDEEIDGRTLTAKSDIFTLGIILCEYFTGEKPTIDSKFSSTWNCVNNGGEISFKKGIPEPYGNLILRMLSKEAENRPAINEVFSTLKGKPIDSAKKKAHVGLRGMGIPVGRTEEKSAKTPTCATTESRRVGLRGDLLKIAKKE